MKCLGIVLVVALGACSPPQPLPDRAEPDAQVIDDAAPDARSEPDASAAVDVTDAAAADADADANGADADARADASPADACVDYYTVYTDDDGDGFGAGGPLLVRCGETMSPRSSLRNDDCDDRNARVYPGAVEHCDGLDSNCDGDADRTAPGTPRSLPRDEVHLSCADVGRTRNIWRFPEWTTEPRCAFRGLESTAPYRPLGMTACQVCRADACLCWTDPIGGGGMSIPCPYDG